MTIAEMRAALGLGPEVSDAEVADLYATSIIGAAVAPPAAEPVTFTQAAAQMRLGDDASEQALVEGYITAAREWVEDYTGHIVVQRLITDQFSAFAPRLYLTKRPVVEVTGISYTDAAGTAASFAGFRLGFDRTRAHVSPAAGCWPRLAAHGSVAVTYLAGYADGEVPQRIRQAILLATADFYKNRTPFLSAEAERAIAWLLRGLRRRVL